MKLPRGDLVAEGLADLGDAEGHLAARRSATFLKLHEDALGRLGAQVDDGAIVLDRAHVRLEHEVEATGGGGSVRADEAQLLVVGSSQSVAVGARRLGELVGAEAAVAGAAVDQRVREGADVAGGDPYLGCMRMPRVEADHVVALVDHASATRRRLTLFFSSTPSGP